MASLLTRLKIDSAEFKKVSVIVLILTNLVPIYGVLFMDWQVFPILFLFWIENLIIGVSNVFKMILCSPDNPGQWVAKAFLIPFFCVHYGIFTLVHGIFIVIMFGGSLNSEGLFPDLAGAFGVLANLQLGWAALALLISHIISLAVNYIGNGEYKKSSLVQLMQQPYGRVVILHVTIIIGGFLIMLLGSPVVGLVLLIALKIFIDVKTHTRQHSFFSISRSKTAGTASV